MERIIFLPALLLLSLSFSGCETAKMANSGSEILSQNSSSVLLGPEAFPFCDGWVSLWGQAEPGRTRLFVKLSPPAQKSWHLWNAQVIVESPDAADRPLPFTEVNDFNTADERTNVVAWNVDMGSLNPRHGLKVALRAFEGCPEGQPMRGIVLKAHD